jgi:colicin import membrane protein
MGQRRESSILFSLKGLLDMERDRAERKAILRFREAERARTEREQRERSERLAEEQEQRRKREEQQRLDAMRRSLVESQRAEAEVRAQLELAEKQHAHERRMTAARAELHRRRNRVGSTAALLVAVATLVAATGLYFGKLRPEARRLHLAYDGLIAAERARAEAAERMRERADGRRRELSGELALARRKLEQAERELEQLRSRSPGAAAHSLSTRSRP